MGNSIYLDCSGLHNIRIDKGDMPSSIWIDGQDFINRLNEAIERMAPTFIKLNYFLNRNTHELIFNLSSFSSYSDHHLTLIDGKTYLLDELSTTKLLEYIKC